MAITSRGMKITLILLAILLVLGGLLVGLYLMGVFPAYNQLIRQILWPQVVEEEKRMEEQQENLLRQQTSIQGLFPHLLSMEGKAAEIDVMVEQTPPRAPVYFCPDEYTLQLISFHEEPVAEGETGSPAQKQEPPLWTYVGEYPLEENTDLPFYVIGASFMSIMTGHPESNRFAVGTQYGGVLDVLE